MATDEISANTEAKFMKFDQSNLKFPRLMKIEKVNSIQRAA